MIADRTPPDPRNTTDGSFPEGASSDVQLRFMLNYAVLAPSVLNTQPWRFVVEGKEVCLYADRTRQLRAVDTLGRDLMISCGAALMNLRLAARHYGYGAPFELLPEPADSDLLARLRLGTPAPATADENDLFRAIAHRRTERRPFATTPVDDGAVHALRAEAQREGAHLHRVQGTSEKAAVADLVAEAVRLQGADPECRAELRVWLRTDRDPRPDGVPDAEQDPEDLRVGARVPTAAHAETARYRTTSAPALLVVTSRHDDERDWLMAGQALQRVLLRATALGLAASYLNPAVEVESVRERLTLLVGGEHPQVVLRMGYPVPRGGAPRRRVGDVAS